MNAFTISDGRRIEVRDLEPKAGTANDIAIVMVQPDGAETTRCYFRHRANAEAEAASIVRGIEFDLVDGSMTAEERQTLIARAWALRFAGMSLYGVAMQLGVTKEWLRHYASMA